MLTKEIIKKLQCLDKPEISIEELSNIVGVRQECLEKRCDYFTHYQAYYDPSVNGRKLEHEEFHAATKMCLQAQEKVNDWFNEHKDFEGDICDDPTGKFLWDSADKWERKVAA